MQRDPRRPPTASTAGRTPPEATPLLTVADEQELLDLGRRSTDGWAVAALGLYLGAVTAFAWVWSRKPRPETPS